MTAFTTLVLAAIVWGALAFAAVYPWAYWPLAALISAIGIWGMRETTAWRQGRSRRLVWSLTAVAVAIAIQLIPWPASIFLKLAPAADRFLTQFDVAYAFQPAAWHATSIHPAATLTALLLFIALCLFFFGLVGKLASLRLEWLIDRLALFGVAVSIFGVVQRAFFVENQPTVYGFWRPRQGAMPFGPFINRNHFAGWAIMLLALAFGHCCAMVQASWHERGGRLRDWLVWLTRPEAGRVALVGFSVLTMAAALAVTASRSGIAGFIVAMAVLGYFVVRQASRHWGRLIATVAIVAVVGGALEWGGLGEAMDRFSRASSDLPGRLTAWHDTTRMIHDFPIFGIGLGTYGDAMLVYQSGLRDQIFVQAHNDYLQLAAEGGLLVCVPVAITLVFIAMLVWRRFAEDRDPLTRWIRSGAVAGLIGIAAQSLVEFSLQMPGIAVLFVLLLAIAVHRPNGRTHHAHRV